MKLVLQLSLLIFLVPASAQTEERAACIPVPPDYKVQVTVEQASILSLFDVLACTGSLVPVFFDKSLDHPISVHMPKPGRFVDAVAAVNRSLQRSGWQLSMSKGRLLLERYKAVADWARTAPGNASRGTNARMIIHADDHVVGITTRGVDVPSREVLDQPKAVQQLDERRFILSKELRSLAAKDPLAFAAEAGAAPTLMGLMPAGFLLSFVKPGGVVDRMGLQSGDILVSVNNIRLVHIADAFSAYASLRGSDMLTLRLLRKGTPLERTYEFR